jgi:hypothetical protein
MTDTSMRWQVRRGWQWLCSSTTAMRQRYRGWRTARLALRELELGRSPDGSTVVLDYRSGQLVAKRATDSPGLLGPLVPFEYADRAWLERVIATAGYRVCLDDDGDLEVQTEVGPAYVRRGDDAAVIRFFVHIVDDLDAFSDNRYELVNDCNVRSTQGRWVLRNDGVLVMSCDLYAGAGITSAQVLNALRALTHEVSGVAAHHGIDRSTT